MDARIGLIWAQATDGVIGDAGSIPWHLPEDLAHFKELTLGAAVIMGRRTWDSLPVRFRPLAGRRNIVITRQEDWVAEGAIVVHSLAAALDRAADASVWIIGGGEIYRQAMEFADRLEITEVDLEAAGDTRAPDAGAGWSRSVTPDEGWLESRTGIRYRFVSMTRGGATGVHVQS